MIMEYCCERFKESAEEQEIVHAGIDDETEWFIPELWHLYYCPFCGALIKGQGWGTYDQKENKKS